MNDLPARLRRLLHLYGSGRKMTDADALAADVLVLR